MKNLDNIYMISLVAEKSVSRNGDNLIDAVESFINSLQNQELLITYGIGEKYRNVWFIMKGFSQSQILQLVESYAWTSDYNYEINELLQFHQVVHYSKSSTN